MPDYLLLMHDDADGETASAWPAYLARLRSSGRFQGGSAIGDGACMRKSEKVPGITARLTGFLRVTADDLDHARMMVIGNPVFEAGGTVEIRELPQTD